MKVKVQTLDAKSGGDLELNDEIFGVEPRADILHRVVTWQLEKRRGTARAARERSDVARTGKKFGRQKGGGTARHGNRAAPQFIGGGKAHGPRARDFDPGLNKKIRRLGLAGVDNIQIVVLLHLPRAAAHLPHLHRGPGHVLGPQGRPVAHHLGNRRGAARARCRGRGPRSRCRRRRWR